MPGTTHVTSSSTDTPRPTGVRDDVDLDRTVWFGGGEAYHRATEWGPACVDQIGRLDEHTLGDAVDEGKRPCRQCEPVDYRRVATDGGQKYTPLQHFAAEISGKLCLDARAVPELDAISIYATQAALRDNRDRLRDDGYRAEIDVEHEPMRLLVYPSDEDLDDAAEVATDGGVHVGTSDEDLAAHEHANDLEAALDYVMEAVRRAEELGVDDVAKARLQLAECGARLGFYATSETERELVLDDAREHLEAAVDAIGDVDVTHPARHALQFYVAREELRRPEPTPEPAPAPSPSTSATTSTSGFTFLKKTTAGTLSVLTGVFAGLSLANADFVNTVETSAGDAIVTSAPGTAFWVAVGLMTVSTLLVAYATTGGRR